MKTIVGQIVSHGAPVHCLVEFISRSTPLFPGAGKSVPNQTKRLRTNPVTGEFSVGLDAGEYDVIYRTTPRGTTFRIAVPDGDGEMEINEVVTTATAYVYEPPNTLWNGTRAGHITFLPIDPPPMPTTEEVEFEGGNAETAFDAQPRKFLPITKAQARGLSGGKKSCRGWIASSRWMARRSSMM